jgi:hypothetical protein
MRRPPILLALAVVGALLGSCGKSGHVASSATAGSTAGAKAGGGSSITKQRALAFASAVNLTRADVPGFTASAKQSGESASEKQLEREMIRCAGIAGTEKGLAESSSPSFALKRGIVDLGVSSEVGVERTAAQAQRGLTAIRSAHVRGCFSRYLAQVFKGKKFGGATVGAVTIQSGDPPAPGTSGGFGWRVTATFSVRGIKVPVYLDFLGFVDGPAEVTLLSSGLLRPFPAEVQQRLFALLLTRAKAHRL